MSDVLIVGAMIGLTVGMGIASFVLAIVALYLTAKYKIHASFTKTGTMELVVRGNDLVDVLVNVAGHYWNRETGRLEEGEDPYIGFINRWLRKECGFYWVGILYPYRRIYKFVIASPDKVKSENELRAGQVAGQEIAIRDRLKSQEDRPVDHLRWEPLHPVLIRDVLIKDGTRLDFLVQLVLHVDNPGQAVMIHDAQFFSTLNVATDSTIRDFAKVRTNDEVNQLPIGPAADKNLREFRKAINLAKPKDGMSVGENTGMMVIDMYIVAYGPSPVDADVAEAKSDVVVAEYERQAALKRAEGNRALLEAPIRALVEQGVSANMAAAVVGSLQTTTAKWEGVRQTQVTTLVEAGVETGVTLPLPSLASTSGSPAAP